MTSWGERWYEISCSNYTINLIPSSHVTVRFKDQGISTQERFNSCHAEEYESHYSYHVEVIKDKKMFEMLASCPYYGRLMFSSVASSSLANKSVCITYCVDHKNAHLLTVK